MFLNVFQSLKYCFRLSLLPRITLNVLPFSRHHRRYECTRFPAPSTTLFLTRAAAGTSHHVLDREEVGVSGLEALELVSVKAARSIQKLVPCFDFSTFLKWAESKMLSAACLTGINPSSKRRELMQNFSSFPFATPKGEYNLHFGPTLRIICNL